MIEPGYVEVAPQWEGARLQQLHVRYHTQSWSRLLVGATAIEVAQRVPMLFSLCGQAQGACARLALGHAGAALNAAAALGQTARARLAEAVFEHAWRLMIDWPGIAPTQAGAPDAARAALAQWAKVLRPMRAGLAPADEALACAARLDEALRAQVDAAAYFIAANAPQGGDPLNLSASVRQRWQAWQAAVALLAAPPEQIAAHDALGGRAWSDGAGMGVAEIHTARGVLRHTVQLNADQVLAYAIASPTDRWFGPEATWPHALAGKQFASQAQGMAYVGAAVLAHDPCVAWRWAATADRTREAAG